MFAYSSNSIKDMILDKLKLKEISSVFLHILTPHKNISMEGGIKYRVMVRVP